MKESEQRKTWFADACIDDYLALLSTLSPYIRLDPQKRDSLFEGLRAVLERNCIRNIQTSYLSVVQIAQKVVDC